MTELISNIEKKMPKLGDLIRKSSSSEIYPLSNFGAVVNCAYGNLCLTDYDMGKGTFIVRLIRKTVDFEKADQCTRLLTDSGDRKVMIRSYKKISSTLDQFAYKFTPAEKKQIMQEMGRMNDKSFLEISCDSKWGSTWILYHSGAKVLSNIITQADPERYTSVGAWLEDLRLVQKIGAMSRRVAIHRFFSEYYGTSNFEDVSIYTGDHPYHVVRPGAMKVYLASRPTTGRLNLFLCGIRDGAMFYQPRNRRSVRGAQIGLSGCGRIAEPADVIPQELIDDCLLGIYHSSNVPYRKVLPCLYQPISQALPAQEIKVKMWLNPIFNYRVP